MVTEVPSVRSSVVLTSSLLHPNTNSLRRCASNLYGNFSSSDMCLQFKLIDSECFLVYASCCTLFVPVYGSVFLIVIHDSLRKRLKPLYDFLSVFVYLVGTFFLFVDDDGVSFVVVVVVVDDDINFSFRIRAFSLYGAFSSSDIVFHLLPASFVFVTNCTLCDFVGLPFFMVVAISVVSFVDAAVLVSGEGLDDKYSDRKMLKPVVLPFPSPLTLPLLLFFSLADVTSSFIVIVVALDNDLMPFDLVVAFFLSLRDDILLSSCIKELKF